MTTLLLLGGTGTLCLAVGILSARLITSLYGDRK